MTTTIKSIKADYAIRIEALRAERDEAIQAIRQARTDALIARQERKALLAQEQAEREAHRAKQQAQQAEFRPYVDKWLVALYPNKTNHIAFIDYNGFLSHLNEDELNKFNKEMGIIIKQPLNRYNFDCEAYNISATGPKIAFTIRTEEERAEWVESKRSIFEKAGITHDLPESQFQLLWDMYLPLQPMPDLFGDYGLCTPWDYEWLVDVEDSRKDAFCEWACDLNAEIWGE